MAKVLKTRMVGQMPDSRHLMAPPEIVYVVEGEVRESRALLTAKVLLCLVAGAIFFYTLGGAIEQLRGAGAREWAQFIGCLFLIALGLIPWPRR